MIYLTEISNWLVATIDWFVANPMMLLLALSIIIILKGLALYRAARKGSVVWFWLILIINTLGMLPLLYLIFSKGEDR